MYPSDNTRSSLSRSLGRGSLSLSSMYYISMLFIVRESSASSVLDITLSCRLIWRGDSRFILQAINYGLEVDIRKIFATSALISPGVLSFLAPAEAPALLIQFINWFVMIKLGHFYPLYVYISVCDRHLCLESQLFAFPECHTLEMIIPEERQLKFLGETRRINYKKKHFSLLKIISRDLISPATINSTLK